MYRARVVRLLAGGIGLVSVTQAAGQETCKPTLVITDVQFSEMQPPTLERRWTAIVSIDASRCDANSRGYFEIAFTRLKETAPDMEFRERFAWLPPLVSVEVDFGADEAAGRYWIDSVHACTCAK
jgi:hypothetical protein